MHFKFILSPVKLLLQMCDRLFRLTQLIMHRGFLTLNLAELFKNLTSVQFLVFRLLLYLIELVLEFLPISLNLLPLLAHKILEVRAEFLLIKSNHFIIF